MDGLGSAEACTGSARGGRGSGVSVEDDANADGDPGWVGEPERAAESEWCTDAGVTVREGVVAAVAKRRPGQMLPQE